MNAEQKAAKIVGKYVGFSDPAIYAPLIADVAAALTEAVAETEDAWEQQCNLALAQTERAIKIAENAALAPSPALVAYIAAVESYVASVSIIDFSGDSVPTTAMDTALAALRKEMGL